MKYLVIIIVFLAVWCVYQNLRINSLIEKNNALKSKNQALIINNERLVKNEVELRKQKEKIKEALDSEKLNFDWRYNLADSDVRRMLADSCLSCKR